MNILSLDQASVISGYAIFDLGGRIVAYGIIDLSKLPKSTQQDQANKRNVLINNIHDLVQKYDIQQIITEGIYYHSNQSTYEKLAKVQGCVQDYAVRKNLVCFSWANAGEWRKWISITGKKREDYKAATKRYVIENFDVPDDLVEDIYDAIGICSAYFVMLK